MGGGSVRPKQAGDWPDHEQLFAQLQASEAVFHALVESLPLNIFRKDEQGRFVFGNQRFCQLLGKSLDELVGKTDYDLFPEELADKYRHDDEQVMASGESMRAEEKHRRSDGESIYVEVLKAPVHDAEGRATGILGMFWDVTARVLAQAALQRAKEAADAANRAKSEFLANMSHEIRTPMNAIIGMTELVLDSKLADPQREYLHIVKDSADSLLSVINDVLDFSKIEAGKLELNESPFDFRDSLADTMRSLTTRAHNAGLELAFEVGADVPQWLVGDANRFRQIIVNLVGNAIKFTRKGEVVVTVDYRGQQREQVALHFAVRDTGIGIAKEKQAAIFEAFTQADNSSTRHYGGTGLGLAIASHLVGLMGGSIEVESEVKRGTTFRFTAHMGACESGPEGPIGQEHAGLFGLPVLVVDDNATNRRILHQMLCNWNMTPTSASGAKEALEAIRRASGRRPAYDLILLDVHMPEMDGYALAGRIRKETDMAGVSIIMLSSGDSPGDEGLVEQLRIGARLLKPVKQSELFSTIVAIRGQGAGGRGAGGRGAGGRGAGGKDSRHEVIDTRPNDFRPLRVLLAEDSKVNQKLASALLKKRGHSVSVANNGREAVTALENADFDVVLMDVQMPDMDGMEATAAIRSREKQTGVHIPIVAMTAHAMKGDRERCLAAGMDAYVAKPIRAEELFNKVESLASQRG